MKEGQESLYYRGTAGGCWLTRLAGYAADLQYV